MKNLGELSDEELLASVHTSVGHERRWVARVVAYLAEIEASRADGESQTGLSSSQLDLGLSTVD